jgi:predicted small metal-binding protein
MRHCRLCRRLARRGRIVVGMGILRPPWVGLGARAADRGQRAAWGSSGVVPWKWIERLIRRRSTMPKELRCGDLMPGCSTVVEGKDEAEVMAKATEHAKKEHGLSTIPPEVAAKAKAAIKNK